MRAKRGSLLMAGNRLLEPFEQGQDGAEFTERLRAVRRQGERSSVGALRLDKKILARQRDPAVEMRLGEPRHQLDGAAGALQSSLVSTLEIKDGGQIGVGHSKIGLQINRPPAGGCRFVEPA